MISKALFSTAKRTGAGAIAAAGGSTALKAAGVSAVRHYCGRWIATKTGLYLAGTLGAPGAAVVAAPVVAVGLGVATVALTAAGIAAATRGL
jgi:hypothetical protein